MSLIGTFVDRLINGPSGGVIRLPQASSQRLEEARRRPVEPTTGQPLEPRAQPGYYPGFHTLDQKDFWDEATRAVVLDRVENLPPIRFFSTEEATLMEAIVNRLLPQDDREEAYRIPIVPQIDRKLYEKIIPGYRYEDMPPEQEAFRLGLQGIEAISAHLFGKAFVDLGPTNQDQVLLTLHDGKPPAGELIWKRLPVTNFWVQILSDCCEAYYAHPYAWDEIGFGGPSYPRGYYRLLNGEPEPWEAEERRYSWAPPPSCSSDRDEGVGHGDITYMPGQAGTH
ncbi:MAG: gluconate 2-dehydrogenase subunit 3 family protein [Chloroflexota bacterium]